MLFKFKKNLIIISFSYFQDTYFILYIHFFMVNKYFQYPECYTNLTKFAYFNLSKWRLLKHWLLNMFLNVDFRK